MRPQVRIVALEGEDGQIRLSPPLFVDNKVDADPSDLSRFAPQGNGVYGLRYRDIEPFGMAESMQAESGVIFFDAGQREEDFFGLLRVLEIANRCVPGNDGHKNRYWAFREDSEMPGHDGYLTQIRVMDRFALRFLYDVLDRQGFEAFPEQPLPLPHFLWAFVLDQQKRYGTSFGHPALKGKFGGDGDFAQEALSFGLMVENSYHGVYRIWSRAWLCTK